MRKLFPLGAALVAALCVAACSSGSDPSGDLADLPPASTGGGPATSGPSPAAPAPQPQPSAPEFTRVWHVATTGSDNGPGTEASPFRTIGQALEAVGPGEAVFVA